MVKRLNYIVLLISLVFGTGATAQTGRPIALEANDQQLVEHYVSQETLHPDRARVYGLSAGLNSHGSTIVCGFVSALDASGFYGEARVFYGILLGNEANERMFAVMSIAPNQFEEEVLFNLCSDSGANLAN